MNIPFQKIKEIKVECVALFPKDATESEKETLRQMLIHDGQTILETRPEGLLVGQQSSTPN